MRRTWLVIVLAFAGVAGLTVLLLALLTNIFERKQEARQSFVRVVEVTEDTMDPSVWGRNWPNEYDTYLRTSEPTGTKYGGRGLAGGDADPAPQKLERYPRGSSASSRAMPLPSTTATGVVTPTRCSTRSARSASPKNSSRGRVCSVTRRTSRSTASSARVTSRKASRPSPVCRTATLTTSRTIRAGRSSSIRWRASTATTRRRWRRG
jgi:hypothetical protein